ELQLDIEGPGLARQDITPHVYLTPELKAPETAKPAAKDTDDFAIEPALVARGRQEFAAAGCANCHQLHEKKKPIVSALTAPPLAKLRPEGGCLTGTAGKGRPVYPLSQAQRTALVDA